jgi:hypothetical protein
VIARYVAKVGHFSGRQGQGTVGTLIYHRKGLIGKDLVDWTRNAGKRI